MPRSLIPVAAPAVLGCGFAAYAYFAIRTGVTGSEGALLALIGAVAVMLGIFVACFTKRKGVVFGMLAFLIAFGAVLTAVAGFFLMQYGLATTMALTIVGLTFGLLSPASAKRSV